MYPQTVRLALIKITKSPYQKGKYLFLESSLALIKITKSPYRKVADAVIVAV